MKKFIFLSLFVCSLFAHPHTFIDVFPTVDSSDNKIKNVNFKWSFDEMTSQLLMMEFDQNGDGVIDAQESDYAKINYFHFLEGYNYYTDIKILNKSIKTEPLDFRVFIDENQKIVYEFIIKINQNKQDVKIDFYDEDMFTALMLKDEFITSDLGFKVVDVDNDYYLLQRLQFN